VTSTRQHLSFGLYKPNVMQFGLCNALSTFQRMVDKVLAEEKNSGHVEVYVDDIMVHTEDRASNHYWTGRVLMKLEENHLFCRKEKCSFEQDQVGFLGVLLAAGTVSVSPRKVQAIKDEKPPASRKGVHCFLGITNYHRKFICNYPVIVRLLHDLTKDVKFKWTNQCVEAFEQLKEVLVMVPHANATGGQRKVQVGDRCFGHGNRSCAISGTVRRDLLASQLFLKILQ
jgi:hypothetical protein